ncbi:MAG: PKD domain-containing protein, partial [Pedobacter sp.]
TYTIEVPKGVSVGDKPKVNFSVNPTDFCAKASAQFTDLSDPIPQVNRWQWTFGDGESSSAQNPSHLFGSTGNYDIKLTAYNNGCPTTLTIPKMVNVKAPIAAFSVDLCSDPFTKIFTDRSQGAITWLWEFGDGETSTQQNPSHTYKTKGTYVVKLTTTNGACDYTTSQTIHVINDKVTLTINDDVVCKNTDVTYEIKGADPLNVFSYNWKPENAPAFLGTTTYKQSYADRGNYRVEVDIMDINKCIVSYNTQVKVISPRPDFTSIQILFTKR